MTFRLLTEADVKAVLSMDDLIETMGSALHAFSTGRVAQPVRTVIPLHGDHAFFGLMPAFVRGDTRSNFGEAGSAFVRGDTRANFGEAGSAFVRGDTRSNFGEAGSAFVRGDTRSNFGEAGSAFVRGDTRANFGPSTHSGPSRPSRDGEAGSAFEASLGAKLVTVVGSNATRGLPSHLASIVLLDPETGALKALLDGRYITEARTAAVSAVSSRLLTRKTAKSLAIIGSGVQAHSHLEALSRVHSLRQVTVWSPHKLHRDAFVEEARTSMGSDPRSNSAASERGQTPPAISAVDHAGEAVVGADVIVLVTSSPTPVIEDGWVKPGAHVISVGACRPNQREMDPALVARARLFVDSRAAALVESGDVVLGIQEGRFAADHIVAEIGELVAGAAGRRSDAEVTVFKSLGLAVEDVTAAELAYRRAVERGIGRELEL